MRAEDFNTGSEAYRSVDVYLLYHCLRVSTPLSVGQKLTAEFANMLLKPIGTESGPNGPQPSRQLNGLPSTIQL